MRIPLTNIGPATAIGLVEVIAMNNRLVATLVTVVLFAAIVVGPAGLLAGCDGNQYAGEKIVSAAQNPLVCAQLSN